MIASTVFRLSEEDITRKRCLNFYLQDQLEALRTGNIQMSGNDLVSKVTEVYVCLCNVWIQEESSAIKNTRPILSFQNLEKVSKFYYVIV